MLPSRIFLALLVFGLLAASPAQAQQRWCGGHRIEWVGGAPGRSFGLAPPTDSSPRGEDRNTSGGGYDPTHFDGSEPTIEEPAGLNRERWEALIFDAEERPMADCLYCSSLAERQTLVIDRDVVPTIGICIQSPETSATGKRLERYSDAAWWRRQFDRWTGLQWNGEIRIAACTEEPSEGWIHVREGTSAAGARAFASTRRNGHPSGPVRWLSSELVFDSDFVEGIAETNFEVILAHELGHALGYWHVFGAGFVMGYTQRATWPLEESSLARLAYRVGPGVRYPGLVRADVPAGDAGDRAALTTLYETAGGQGWSDNGNWDTDAPLERWHGVTTDGDGRVTQLSLHVNNLAGALPPELGSLSRLWALDLDQNDLTGAIPPELGELSNLELLELAGNALAGPLPPELGKLSRLKLLKLWNNKLTGSIPAALGDLENLEDLGLIGNSLTGSIPPALGNLKTLRHIDLRYNNLTGSIPPALGDMSDLTALQLGRNGLTGPIPPTLARLSNLRTLHLNSNNLSGPIPADLARLPRLRDLDLYNNDLSGPIPGTLGDLSELWSLSLSGNNLSGEVPEELGRLSNLVALTLDGNNLTGPLPASLTNITGLRYLRIQDNAGLCAPADAEFQAWLEDVPEFRGEICGAETVPALPAVWLLVAALLLGGLGAGVAGRRSAGPWRRDLDAPE